MRTVYNLGHADNTLHFDDNTCADYAVVYAYLQDNEAEFKQFMLDIHNNTVDYSKYPLTYGEFSVACGDWATLL